MSNPFRVGDRVSLDGCEKDVCTIVDRTSYYYLDRGTHSYGEKRLQLVEPCSQGEREEVERAMGVFERYGILRDANGYYPQDEDDAYNEYTKEQLLNKLFNFRTPVQKEIKAIEAEMRELADRLKELKNERP